MPALSHLPRISVDSASSGRLSSLASGSFSSSGRSGPGGVPRTVMLDEDHARELAGIDQAATIGGREAPSTTNMDVKKNTGRGGSGNITSSKASAKSSSVPLKAVTASAVAAFEAESARYEQEVIAAAVARRKAAAGAASGRGGAGNNYVKVAKKKQKKLEIKLEDALGSSGAAPLSPVSPTSPQPSEPRSKSKSKSKLLSKFRLGKKAPSAALPAGLSSMAEEPEEDEDGAPSLRSVIDVPAGPRSTSSDTSGSLQPPPPPGLRRARDTPSPAAAHRAARVYDEAPPGASSAPAHTFGHRAPWDRRASASTEDGSSWSFHAPSPHPPPLADAASVLSAVSQLSVGTMPSTTRSLSPALGSSPSGHVRGSGTLAAASSAGGSPVPSFFSDTSYAGVPNASSSPGPSRTHHMMHLPPPPEHLPQWSSARSPTTPDAAPASLPPPPRPAYAKARRPESPLRTSAKAPASEDAKMRAAVSRLGIGPREEDVVALLMSLPKKERALCLFNTAVLKQKVEGALAVLDVDDSDEPGDGDSPSDADEYDAEREAYFAHEHAQRSPNASQDKRVSGGGGLRSSIHLSHPASPRGPSRPSSNGTTRTSSSGHSRIGELMISPASAHSSHHPSAYRSDDEDPYNDDDADSGSEQYGTEESGAIFVAAARGRAIMPAPPAPASTPIFSGAGASSESDEEVDPARAGYMTRARPGTVASQASLCVEPGTPGARAAFLELPPPLPAPPQGRARHASGPPAPRHAPRYPYPLSPVSPELCDARAEGRRGAMDALLAALPDDRPADAHSALALHGVPHATHSRYEPSARDFAQTESHARSAYDQHRLRLRSSVTRIVEADGPYDEADGLPPYTPRADAAPRPPPPPDAARRPLPRPVARGLTGSAGYALTDAAHAARFVPAVGVSESEDETVADGEEEGEEGASMAWPSPPASFTTLASTASFASVSSQATVQHKRFRHVGSVKPGFANRAVMRHNELLED